MAWPKDPLKVRVRLAFGADLTADPASWTFVDVSTYALGTVVIRRGRADVTQRVQPTRVGVKLNNPDKRFTPFHPGGVNYPNVALNTPLEVAVDYGSGWVVRALVFVDEWELDWPAGDSGICHVYVSASGIRRRLQNGPVLRSAMYRSLTARNEPTPVAYWPCEDASGSTRFAPAVGNKVMNYYGPNGLISLAAGSFDGSSPLPKLGLGATVAAVVPPYATSSTQWAVRYVLRIPNTVSVDSQIGEIDTGGTVVKWLLFWKSGNVAQLRGYNSAGTELLSDPGVTVQHPDGTPYTVNEQVYVVVNAAQSGGNIAWDYSILLSDGGTGNSGTVVATIGNVNQIHFTSLGSLDQVTAGHFAVAADVNYASVAGGASIGWASEDAASRFLRLLGEQAMPIALGSIETSASDYVAKMGIQQQVKFLDLLDQIEDTDGGLLREAIDGVADGYLIYRTQSQRQNRAVDLTLSCTSRQVKLPWQPVHNDERVHNDITVERIGGSSARATTNAPDDYPDQKSLNLWVDDDLPYHAQWLLHLGQVDEMRVPGMSIDLFSNPELVASWINCDVGSWFTVTGLPTQYPPGTLRLIIEGWTETIDAVTWRIDELTSSPSRPWEVWQVEHTQWGRLESDGSTLASGATAIATSLSVATASGPLWTTSAGDRPFDIDVAGEQMTVTNVTGSSSPQTFTVVRSVNGAVKAQLSGAVVQLWRGGVLAQ